MVTMGVNDYILLIFAPILVLAGLAGFIIPERKSLTSGARSYNVFHIVFGMVGIAIVCFALDTSAVRWFNAGFGIIDLYQAAASRMNWFPVEYFKWKQADDVLHIIIGLLLVIVGLLV